MIVILIAGTIGSMLKILGGILYGSNTLFVDALTSIANMIALLVVIWSRRVTTIPPDSDHHFGHERFEYIGVLVMIITYGFVAGISITRLYYVREYSVELNAF
ncbi:MAG: cation transporter, partial [Desulfurococcus sp.]